MKIRNVALATKWNKIKLMYKNIFTKTEIKKLIKAK